MAITLRTGFGLGWFKARGTGGTPDDPIVVAVDLDSIERTPSLLRVDDEGIIAAGAYSVSIANAGSFPGTLLGTLLQAREVVTLSAPLGDTLAAISYDATGTSFLIGEVR